MSGASTTTRPPSAGGDLAAVALCLVLGAAYWLTIRPGHGWVAGDPALYLMHARNILAGRPYGETMFLFNPDAAMMSPAAYPPGASLLMAPVLLLFGLDLVAIKQAMVITLVLTLFCLYRLARPSMGPGWALLVVAAAGLSPALVLRRDAIGSDMPFVLWCYVALLAVRSVPPQPMRALARAAMLALAVAMALLTRSIGITLVAALALYLVLQRGPWLRWYAPALAIALLAATAVTLSLRIDNTTYVNILGLLAPDMLVRHFAGAAQAYGFALVELFGLEFGRVANAVVLGLLVLLLAAAFIDRLRREITAIDLFVLSYGAALLIFPLQAEPTRYALPILPLLLLRLVGLLCRWPLARLPFRPAIVIALFAVLYVPFYARHNVLGHATISVDDAPSRDLFTFLHATPAGTVLMARNARTVALFADRPTVAWPMPLTDSGFWSAATRFHAALLVAERRTDPAATAALDALIAAHADRFRPVFDNRAFTVYAIAPAIPAPAPGR